MYTGGLNVFEFTNRGDFAQKHSADSINGQKKEIPI